MSQTHRLSKDPEADGLALPTYRSLLVAVDSSDHANRASQEAIDIARVWQAQICGTHVYAAKLHDIRFRQMEGGLPEQFRQEDELERQREVHDDLITRGLSIITDSYLDQLDSLCEAQRVNFRRRALEGKNYRELTREANSGQYDLLIMGAKGLGAVSGSQLGTVCERVCRRSQVDTLVIKDPSQALSQAPIVVAIDGSAYAYGGLLRGIALAQHWGVDLHVISAFDPYYHYVAFNRKAGVLSEEAGKVFRFQEQEQLHEEIIDSGLAKIYDGHLSIAREIADQVGQVIESRLLDGKPWEAILKYLEQVKPGLLILGQTGIHADDELDIGGNSENLLRLADCAVLLSRYAHQPQVEQLAEVTTSWTVEAEARMKNVPSFVQNMARTAILRYAQERGHTVITEGIVVEATQQLMPSHAEQAMEEIVAAHDAGELKRSVTTQAMQWSNEAQALLETIEDDSLRANLAGRAEKKARSQQSYLVEQHHIAAFLDDKPQVPHWQAAALARLSRVPDGFMRDSARQRIEAYAQQQGLLEIGLETAEAGLDLSRQAMQQMTEQDTSSSRSKPNAKGSICPFARAAQARDDQASDDSPAKTKLENSQASQHWSKDAEQRLASVPPGYCRDMTRSAAERIAQLRHLETIDAPFLQEVLDTFKQGSGESQETLEWTASARERIAKAPEMVRGMLIREIETWVRNEGLYSVNDNAVDAVKAEWASTGIFHLSGDDPRHP